MKSWSPRFGQLDDQGRVHSPKSSTKDSHELANPRWRHLAMGSSGQVTGVSVQAKLLVGAADDQYEQQADEVAQAVVSGHTAPAINQGMDESALQTKSGSQNPVNSSSMFSGAQLHSTKGRGQGLDSGVKAQMETSFGRDLSSVRIHNDQTSEQLNQAIGARAFTYGQDVYFGRGEYQPDTFKGQFLLAHELTHTLQQGTRHQGLVQRQAIEDDDEFNRPPPMDIATATALATSQVASESKQSPSTLGPSVPSPEPPGAGHQFTMEMLLAQPDLKRALRNMARDLGYIVNLYAGYPTGKQMKQMEELGVENRLIDPVAFLAHKFGYKDSVAEARTGLIKALKGLPAKAVEGVLQVLLDSAKPNKPGGESDIYGPELSAYEGLPIIGKREFEMDLIPAREFKEMAALSLIGGDITGRVSPRQNMGVYFKVTWPQIKEDKSTEAGESLSMESWKIEVLTGSGERSSGLPGLGGFSAIEYRIPPLQETGTFRFTAPSLPGLYQIRLVDSEDEQSKVLFRVKGSGG